MDAIQRAIDIVHATEFSGDLRVCMTRVVGAGRVLAKKVNSLQAENEQLTEIVNWTQAILTALNAGDIKKDSLLHQKLREVMIDYRLSKIGDNQETIE